MRTVILQPGEEIKCRYQQRTTIVRAAPGKPPAAPDMEVIGYQVSDSAGRWRTVRPAELRTLRELKAKLRPIYIAREAAP